MFIGAKTYTLQTTLLADRDDQIAVVAGKPRLSFQKACLDQRIAMEEWRISSRTFPPLHAIFKIVEEDLVETYD